MTTLSPTSPFVPSVFLDAPQLTHAGQPDWFIASQRKAWEDFTNAPMPGRKDENWRFANLSLLQFDAFKRLPSAETPEFNGLEKTAARVVTVNDATAVRETTFRGVSVLSLNEALSAHAEILKPLLVSPDTKLGGAKFAALHHAQLNDATVIIVPANAEIADPVEIVHWLSGEGASSFPRTIILAGDNARVTVVEHHLTANGDAGFSCGAAQIVAQRGAGVKYIQVNRHNAASKFVHLSTVRCERDAQVKHATFNLGSGYVRGEALSLIAGEGSRSDMLSVSLASANQEIDQRTLQDHLTPRGFSDLLYKNVLFDQSKTIFAGLIRVDEGAHYTDAYQKCRNLLLSDECEANSMPGLEINADEVKCSHGSTSGRLSEEEVFYFRSRGIEREAAEHMISMGFTMEVIARLECEVVESMVIREVEKRFVELEGRESAARK
ncbi:MAG TPA: Fe-S cluster assembly protein SufD [Verrucomicrobiales bacterium]|nr:Fe-S cluster assembly protein SufD [Verrucomicrobiales bacterium]